MAYWGEIYEITTISVAYQKVGSAFGKALAKISKLTYANNFSDPSMKKEM